MNWWQPFSDDPQSFAGISGQARGYGGARWARSGAGGLAPNEGDGKYLANNVAAEDEFGPRRNAGGGYTGYVQPRMPQVCHQWQGSFTSVLGTFCMLVRSPL